MKKIISFILSVTILISLGTTVFADATSTPVLSDKITVGICADFPPFEYYTEGGELCGFDVELMNYIGERLGAEIEFVNMEFDSLAPAVAKGGEDCAISAICITEEREQFVDFTIPYLRATQTYFDGEKSETITEEYAIMFPNNSREKANVLEAAGKKATYTLVNEALKELISENVIEKLVQKYELNQVADAANFSYEYTNLYDEEVKGENGGFKDVSKNHWAVNEIGEMAQRGVVSGYTDGTFKPDLGVKREEFCKLLVVAFGHDELKYDTQSFADVSKDRWSYGYIENGGKHFTVYDNPYGSLKLFLPEESATREEVAAAIVKNLGYGKEDAADKNLALNKFSDGKEISEELLPYISFAVENGIVSGYPDGTFGPKKEVTRAEAVALLYRITAKEDAVKPKNDSEEIETPSTPENNTGDTDTKKETSKVGGFAIVTKVAHGLDDNGEEIIKISCTKNEEEGIIFFGERARNQGKEHTLGVGDVFMYNTDKNGYVTEYIVLAEVTSDNGFRFVGNETGLESAISTRKKPTELVLGYIENSKRKTNTKGEVITVNGEVYVVPNGAYMYTLDTNGRTENIEISDFMYETDYFEAKYDENDNITDYGMACPILLRIVNDVVVDAYTSNARFEIKIK